MTVEITKAPDGVYYRGNVRWAKQVGRDVYMGWKGEFKAAYSQRAANRSHAKIVATYWITDGEPKTPPPTQGPTTT